MSTLIKAAPRTIDAAGDDGAGILLVPWMVAGVRSQYEQMRRVPGLKLARTVEVHPYRKGALLESLPLPATLRGTIRSTMAAASAIPKRRVRGVWTQVALPMLPFALARSRRRTPVFYAIDCTPLQLHRFGRHYAGVDDPSTPQGWLTAASLRLFFRRCAGLLPWSAWAARSMVEDYGVPPHKVHVVAPGIDLKQWVSGPGNDSGRPRILFVGGDFERKGGPLLLDVYRRHFRDECDLHLVTRAAIAAEPGVHVHNDLGLDDPRLREMYRACDVLVIPTLADCFSMAALEAMACGLPVVISAVGGIPEIVVDGETGMLITPGRGDSLLGALRAVLASPTAARRLGSAGRRRAEQRFDARRQAARTVELMLDGGPR